MVFAAASSIAAAGIRPADQKLAERLTLMPSDFRSGWTSNSAPSTRLEISRCATAPKIDGATTGYRDSASFVPRAEHDKRSAGNTARVFASVVAARKWYAWLGRGASACFLQNAVASWKRYRHGFKVSRPRLLHETFPLHCSACPAHSLDAWRWGFTISKQGQNDTTYLFDQVAVRLGRAVLSFSFYSVDFPFGPDAPRLVSKVLARG